MMIAVVEAVNGQRRELLSSGHASIRPIETPRKNPANEQVSKWVNFGGRGYRTEDSHLALGMGVPHWPDRRCPLRLLSMATRFCSSVFVAMTPVTTCVSLKALKN